jgi:hypothetical protein
MIGPVYDGAVDSFEYWGDGEDDDELEEAEESGDPVRDENGICTCGAEPREACRGYQGPVEESEDEA